MTSPSSRRVSRWRRTAVALMPMRTGEPRGGGRTVGQQGRGHPIASGSVRPRAQTAAWPKGAPCAARGPEGTVAIFTTPLLRKSPERASPGVAA